MRSMIPLTLRGLIPLIMNQKMRVLMLASNILHLGCQLEPMRMPVIQSNPSLWMYTRIQREAWKCVQKLKRSQNLCGTDRAKNLHIIQTPCIVHLPQEVLLWILLDAKQAWILEVVELQEALFRKLKSTPDQARHAVKKMLRWR